MTAAVSLTAAIWVAPVQVNLVRRMKVANKLVAVMACHSI